MLNNRHCTFHMKHSYRTIFVSDLHLGAGESQAQVFADFLKNHDCDNLYMVGDMIDGWKLQKRWYWPQAHSNALRKVLTKANRGCRVVYIIGNHDEFIRSFLPDFDSFGAIEIVNHTRYQDLQGRQWFVTHGDMFDAVTRHWKWISKVGDRLYSVLLELNRMLDGARRLFGLGYWSLSQYAKQNTKQAVSFIAKFEEHLARHAHSQGCQGIICGHIHTPAIKKISDVMYMNTGDFCETCSALVETHEGVWQLLQLQSDNQWKVIQQL